MDPPIIIPGKKRPAGIHTPYVIIVKIYHVTAKMAKSILLYSKTSSFVKRVFIEFASVFKKRDAKGLNRSGCPGLVGLQVHF